MVKGLEYGTVVDVASAGVAIVSGADMSHEAVELRNGMLGSIFWGAA